MAYRKFYWIIFSETFIYCMQKIKIGHRAKFRAKSKCFPQILFPVYAAFNFQWAYFDSFSWCVHLGVGCVRACSEKPFRASLSLWRSCYNSDCFLQRFLIRDVKKSKSELLQWKLNLWFLPGPWRVSSMKFYMFKIQSSTSSESNIEFHNRKVEKKNCFFCME